MVSEGLPAASRACTSRPETGTGSCAILHSSPPAHNCDAALALLAAHTPARAHNSHLGDARATDMGQRRGEVNIGQLMREEYGRGKVFNIGWVCSAVQCSAVLCCAVLCCAVLCCAALFAARVREHHTGFSARGPFQADERLAGTCCCRPCCRFTTHTGTVAAADDWDTPVQLKDVRKSMPGSWEHLFHKAAMPEFALDLRSGSQDLRAALEGG